MHLLLSAYSCSPGWGSEPGIGWNTALALSVEHDVHVITTAGVRPFIERELARNPRPSLHFTYVPHVFAGGIRLPSGLAWLRYYAWQVRAYRVARRLVRRHAFDVANHVTFVTWRVPSFYCRLGLPFVHGPIGGGETVPQPLRRYLGLRGRLFEKVRDMCQWISRMDPLVRATLARSTMVLAANDDTRRLIERMGVPCPDLMPAIGHDMAEFPNTRAPRANRLTVASCGTLDPRKGFALAIEAFSAARGHLPEGTRFVIIGAGPERSRLGRLSRRLVTAGAVEFVGRVARARAIEIIGGSDIFLFPTLRDSGGMVVLEAMASGVPVVCLDSGGPGMLVDESCGIKVQPGNPSEVVASLAKALVRLGRDPDLRRHMGERGRERVRRFFTWEKKAKELSRIYSRIVAR